MKLDPTDHRDLHLLVNAVTIYSYTFLPTLNQFSHPVSGEFEGLSWIHDLATFFTPSCLLTRILLSWIVRLGE